MAQGQLTFLQLVNRVLLRCGQPQVTSIDATGTDSWGGFARDMLNDAQQYVWQEHDWSTLWTTGTFTTSSRTYDLSTSFSDFGRCIDLVDTTNRFVLAEAPPRAIDADDPILTTGSVPTMFAINYPNLLFSRTPTSLAYRIRYIKRPTTLSATTDKSILPEACDQVLVMWAYWQLLATREDAQDGGSSAKKLYDAALDRAVVQDERRQDELLRMQSLYPRLTRASVPFPSNYPVGSY